MPLETCLLTFDDRKIFRTKPVSRTEKILNEKPFIRNLANPFQVIIEQKYLQVQELSFSLQLFSFALQIPFS